MQVSFNNFGSNNRPTEMDPDAYAKKYAEQKGISLEEAKAELKTMYGDPMSKQGSILGNNQ